jgi:hypothetical protein
VLRYLPLVAFGGLWLAVEHWHGPIAGTRLFGAAFVVGAIWGTFASSFSVSLGSKELARLQGWRKLLATVPLASLGLATVIYAPEFTCLATKYKNLCT